MRALKTLLLSLALLLGHVAVATHILGGNLGYTYVGETAPGSQIYRYQVYMQFYMNCGADSNYPTLQSLLNTNGGFFPVGVYTQDPLAPGANKQQFTIVNIALTDSSLITPDLPGGCTVGAGLCTKLGIVTGTVDLPLNFGGYHLYFQMNARNLTISNLQNPNNTGIGFYAFIPPPLLPNSSPVWLGDPTPLLCINDTSTFINSATDPDGDQLIFSFEVPYNSVDNGGGIIAPPNVLPNNIPLVNYVGGYSVAQPFGAGGYAFINGATGLTRYVPPLQGNYVVAVEVKEYRNGVLIGRTRRDLQLQAVVCPPNDAPEPLTIQPTIYSVQAGDQLCFNMDFQDPNADSLLLVASGTIFNGTLFNPPATIIAPVTGDGAVASTFCWDTDCDQAQSQPYLFSVSVSDNGCPPRTLDIIYQINVLGFAGPSAITGPAQVCAGQAGSLYSTTALAGVTYAWSVTGGTILSGQGTNSINVDWGVAGPGTVQVSATNAQGCNSAPIDLPVTVAPLPVANAGADVSICAGGSAILGGTPTGPSGSSFSWSPSAGLSSTSTAGPTATPSATTDYIVQVTNSGCVARDTIRVTVSQPTVDAGTDAAFCVGGNTQLQAVGSGTVAWSPVTGLSDPNIADPVAQPLATTTYTVVLTDTIGCVVQDSVTVTVNDLPLVSAGPDVTPCANTTIALGGSPTGPAGSSYAWSPANGLNDPTVGDPELSVTTDAQYVVVVTDANLCVNSDTVNVTVLPLPAVDAGPDLSVCAGESVQLQGSGTGNLQWTPSFNLSDPTVPDPICNPEATITYTLTVTDVNTCTNSDQATVTVNVIPNANAGIDRTICAGDSVMIGTNGPGSFVWSPASGLSATNVATPMAAPSVTTTYVVMLTDAFTCSAEDSVLVTVFPLANAGTDATLNTCSSSTTTDLFALLGGTPDSGGQWLGPDQFAHSSTIDPAVDQPGIYTYITGAGSPCPDSAFVQVAITTPTIQFTGNNAFCTGDSTQITASGGTLYSWTPTAGVSDPSIADPFFSPATTTTYTVQVTDADGCVNSAGTTVTVNALPIVDAGPAVTVCEGAGTVIGGTPTSPTATSFAWSPAAELSDAGVSNPIAIPSATTTYIVTATDAQQCSAQDSVVVTLVPLPILDAGSDVAFCAGGSVQLNATGTGTFTWSPAVGLSNANVSDPVASPAITTGYVVVLSDADGCSSTDSLTVTVDPLPTIDAGTDSWLCLGSSVGLNAISSGGSLDWTPAASLDDPASATPTATPAATTVYTVVVTDGNGCISSDLVTVTVGVDPPIDAGSDVTQCSGTPILLGGNPTSVPGSSYAWSPVAGLDDATSPNPTATPDSTTTYTLVVSNDTCTSVATVTITLSSQGQAGFAARFEPGCEAIRGFFTDTSVGAVSWAWDFGDGNTSNAQNPQAFLPYGQSTLVSLTITDAGGCSETFTQIYTNASYNELVQLDVPNVFTPNGDGQNDVFTLNTQAFLGACTTMEVMNRWGEAVFKSEGNNITWDGRTFSGEPASAGTYFYTISVKDLSFNGSLTLLR